MKEFNQEAGVRKWFGDEWITMQNELNAVMEGLFGHYAKQFILSGCHVSGSNISPGIVFLTSGSRYKICRFAGATGITFPVYFAVEAVEETRLYIDGNVKPVATSYNAVLTPTDTGGLLQLKVDNSTMRFADAMQDAQHRFVTDTEKASYAGQASYAINALRDGVLSAYNTLAKLKIYIDDRTPNAADANAIKAELRGGVSASLDTMLKIVNYINGLTYLPVFRGRSELASTTINWLTSTPEVYKTIATPTELDAEGLVEGKTIGALISGDAELTFSDKFKLAFGSPNYSRTSLNYIQMKCLNATPGSEFILYSITLIAL